MISFELQDHDRPTVSAVANAATNAGAWARLQEACSRGIVGGAANRLDIRIDVFLGELAVLRDLRSLYGEQIELGPKLNTQLRTLKADREQRRRSVSDASSPPSSDRVTQQLVEAKFKRDLKPFQLQNLAKLTQLPHGADFSVPGAGKTTVALANHALLKSRNQVLQLLVVAPIAAFAAWKTDTADCIDGPSPLVHTGTTTLIPDACTFLLTSYHRVVSDYDRIRDYVARQPTHLILDEAHRIKRGQLGVHGRAVLDLAYAARRRDILTGTPAPQGAFDLVALVRFLYPGQDRQILPGSAYVERDGRDEEVLRATASAVSSYFVRTPKASLALPPTKSEVVRRSPGTVQRAIYDALRGLYRGQLALTVASRRDFERLGRIVMYLLEAATNPSLLVAGSDACDEEGFAHPPFETHENASLAELLDQYRLFETPWKYEFVRSELESTPSATKIIVWSTFVRNLKALAKYLQDYQPALVHGGVPPQDGAPGGVVTREQELDRFRHDPNCRVLLANPAACGEGVSLHHWCHHAIYLDRTFNAGHYLQSQDRIHRLGLETGQLTRFTLLLSDDTIDDSVDVRLREKVAALGLLMNDPDLVQVALPEPDEGVRDLTVSDNDADAVIAHLRARPRNAS